MKRKTDNGKASASLLLFFTAAALTVCAVLLFRGAFSFDRSVGRILAVVGGALCTLLGALLWISLIAAIAAGERRNLFLYDRAAGRNLPIEALDVTLVRERLDGYYRAYLRSGRRQDLLPPLVPILAPYLLLVFLDSASEADWRRLLFEPSTLLFELTEGLSRFGLSAPAEILSQAARSMGGAPESVKRALSRHRRTVEDALLSHIREHLDDFDF